MLQVILPRGLIRVMNGIRNPFQGFFFKSIILRNRRPMFLQSTTTLAVMVLVRAIPNIPRVTRINRLTTFLRNSIPPMNLVISMITRVLQCLRNIRFLSMVPTRVVIIISIKMGVMTIRILHRISGLLSTTHVITSLRNHLRSLMFVLTRIVRLKDRVIRLIRINMLARRIVRTIRVTIMIHSGPFLVNLPGIILHASPSTLGSLFRFLHHNKGLRPFARGNTLIMLTRINSRNNGKVVFIVIVVKRDSASLRFQHELFPVKLHLTLINAFLPTLFRPLLSKKLFLHLLLPKTLVLPLITKRNRVTSTHGATLFLLCNIVTRKGEVGNIRRLQKRGSIRVLHRVTPTRVLRLTSIKLRGRVLNVHKGLPRLLRNNRSRKELLSDNRRIAILQKGSNGHLNHYLRFTYIAAYKRRQLRVLRRISLNFAFYRTRRPFI